MNGEAGIASSEPIRGRSPAEAGLRTPIDSVSLDDRGHHAGADGAATFANRETNAHFHRDALALEVNLEFDVVAGHTHFSTTQKGELAGDVRGSEVELGLVAAAEEGRVNDARRR